MEVAIYMIQPLELRSNISTKLIPPEGTIRLYAHRYASVFNHSSWCASLRFYKDHFAGGGEGEGSYIAVGTTGELIQIWKAGSLCEGPLSARVVVFNLHF